MKSFNSKSTTSRNTRAFHIDQAVVSFIAAFLAAGTALSVPFVAGWRQSRSDRRMHLRTAFADFAAEYASAMHSMQWFTRKPANRLTLRETDFESYDKEMHTAFPLLFSSLLKASALDSRLYPLLRPYFDDVVDCDIRISSLNAEIRAPRMRVDVDSEKKLRDALSNLHDEVSNKWLDFPQKAAGELQQSLLK